MSPVIAALSAGNAFASDFSFTGGTNAAGTEVPGGGFMPIISVFDAISGRLLAEYSSFTEPFDLHFERGYAAGNYFATLTQWDNSVV